MSDVKNGIDDDDEEDDEDYVPEGDEDVEEEFAEDDLSDDPDNRKAPQEGSLAPLTRSLTSLHAHCVTPCDARSYESLSTPLFVFMQEERSGSQLQRAVDALPQQRLLVSVAGAALP